ncbi:radical SAM/SPASM domain-containing protein [Clostridium saccharoperbutylacetonicum]|uniref:radical SAM/SPASM domain-containing protein n=1 Tax=Clostridium saccharoperbutylacetonicum TaxID=36745 RepID=UPI000983AA2E|nr:radical SAM/SPASM domain-containing protein [Clostridium saccharoperbutylacetonicum]AQR96985.1 antilisterial bacteriocin subtilosin biosynthesis protein AlbA [Clostridium saccharoperbutylacetonicum]NSB32864.1 radical SAM protein with 4Fe4S-binding SPASM domain [Clostridium saccharoperbutylacetonicum]
MEKFNIPINKGNYTMETQEREELFEKYKAEGWEEEYKEYRENWIKYATNQFVSEYPLLVDIEISSICNLKCPMCYTITDEFKKKVNTKLIDVSLLKKIIDEIAGKVPALRISLRGEPTLHPNIVEFISYAKKSGIKEVSFLTNGSKMTEEFFGELLDAGVDWITVSIDGVGDTYEGIRRPLKFKETLESIKTMKNIKKKKGRNKPVIKIQSIWPAIKNNPEEYYNTFCDYVDYIAFNPLIDYLGNDEDIVYEENFSCPQLYQRIVVGADGLVMMCSNDEENTQVVGNANEESIYDIWHGEKLNGIRNLHKNKDGFMQIPLCKKCYLPRLTEDSETAKVGKRHFVIKNYVNRRQEIGK